jgi:hypothetical protein
MVFIGLVFWIGGLIINWYDECVVNVFVGIFIMFTALMGASMSFANVPSLGIAKAAANSIFAIIDEKSTLDVREAKHAKF